MKITFKNPKTGELRQVKVGFSWILFLFAGFLGIPLFLRKLNVWGAVMLVLWVVYIVLPELIRHPEDELAFHIVMFFIFVGLQIWLGIKGNEMTAKNYLEQGWEMLEPESDITKMAKMRWGLSV